ncbi:MAG: hypothetical protein IJP53_01945 [Synergistaceae bacterium]|nr:hypothetical protein [Synergistaceae bacterium]MBR0094483.1 hypothetical protein [Synergistaceae bacterium]
MLRLNFNNKSLPYDVLRKASLLASKLNVELPGAENYLFRSENFTALAVLLKRYRGKIDLVYIDPPFNTMQDFFISDGRANSISKATDRKAYADKMRSKIFCPLCGSVLSSFASFSRSAGLCIFTLTAKLDTI